LGKTMPSAAEYVEHLLAQRRHHFTTEEAVRALGGSLARVRADLRQLKARGEVVDPHRSFHVIVTPDRRACGCPVPEEFVPPLMQYLQEAYYVALLSAAERYGRRARSRATHRHRARRVARWRLVVNALSHVCS
jgi:hypothetical protein